MYQINHICNRAYICDEMYQVLSQGLAEFHSRLSILTQHTMPTGRIPIMQEQEQANVVNDDLDVSRLSALLIKEANTAWSNNLVNWIFTCLVVYQAVYWFRRYMYPDSPFTLSSPFGFICMSLFVMTYWLRVEDPTQSWYNLPSILYGDSSDQTRIARMVCRLNGRHEFTAKELQKIAMLPKGCYLL